MSASPNVVPRKPAQRLAAVSPLPAGGYFPLSHEMPYQLAWLFAGSVAAQQIVERLMSLVNQRDAKLEREGEPKQNRSPLICTSEFCDDRPFDVRAAQIALEKLLPDENREDGLTRDGSLPALRRISRAHALASGIFHRKEAGRAREAYSYELLTENWPQIAHSNQAEWERIQAERRRALEARRQEVEEEDESVVEVGPDEPLVLLPGAKSRPIRLPAPVCRAFASGLPFETDFTASLPIALHFTVDDVVRTVRCSISDVSPANAGANLNSYLALQTNGLQNGTAGTANSNSYLARQIKELEELLLPLWDRWVPGEPLTEELLGRIATALGECPVLSDDGPSCFQQTLQRNLQKPPRQIQGGWFVWIAEMSLKNWRQGGRRPKAPQGAFGSSVPPDGARDLKFAEEILRSPGADAEDRAWAREVMARTH